MTEKLNSFALEERNNREEIKKAIIKCLDDSILKALYSITRLGGYIIFFSVLNLYLILIPLSTQIKHSLWCLLEINGGINSLALTESKAALFFLTFGGLSCIAQTSCAIKGTPLVLSDYIFHKLIIALVSFSFYGFFF